MAKFLLSDDDTKKLRRLVKSFEAGSLSKDGSVREKQRNAPNETYIGVATSTITAIDGTTAGEGTADVYWIDDDTLTGAEHSFTVYNVTETEIDSGAFVSVFRDPYSGKMIVVPCDCDTTITGCSTCDEAPPAWGLTVSGVTDGACTVCDTIFNGDFVLTNDSLVFESGNPCKWSSPVVTTTVCEPGCNACSRWTVVLTSTVAALMADENQMAAYRISPVSMFDCTGSNTFPKLTGSLHCNNWPADLTITPIWDL